MDRSGELLSLARRQHGAFSYAQALQRGITRRQLYLAVRRGEIERRFPRVYCFNGYVVTQHQQESCAVLWADCDALISHLPAARHYGWDFESRRDRKNRLPPSIIVPSRHANIVEGITIHRTDWLPPEHRSVKDSVPVTKAERTLIDLASILPPEQLAAAVGEAWRANHCSYAGLMEVVLSAPRGYRGATTLRTHLEACAEKTDSPLEDRFLGALIRRGLPMPKVRHPIPLERFTVHPDFAYPRASVAIEVQSAKHHMNRLVFLKDQVRFTQLNARGWRLVLVTEDEFKRDPAGIFRTIEGYLAEVTAKQLSLNIG